jgi:hypothetical protein
VQLQPLVDALAAELLRQPVLHADETPVAMLKPGHGKTHRAYLWSYCTTPFNPIKAVVFDFADSRGGQHVRAFLGLPGTHDKPGWQGKLVTDDFSGYKACFELGVTEVGCMAHARRKFHELWANHGSQVGEQALKFFGQLYDVEREVADADSQARLDARRRSRPVADALHQWMRQQRQKIPDGSATARAIDYSLNRWVALTRFLDDGDLPIDNNWVENRIRPIALGRQNWLFAGSLRAGKRAAAVMSLIHSAKLNGAGSPNCCRIAGSSLPRPDLRRARRQDGFAGSLGLSFSAFQFSRRLNRYMLSGPRPSTKPLVTPSVLARAAIDAPSYGDAIDTSTLYCLLSRTKRFMSNICRGGHRAASLKTPSPRKSRLAHFAHRVASMQADDRFSGCPEIAARVRACHQP